jgi:hypothetical protein
MNFLERNMKSYMYIVYSYTFKNKSSHADVQHYSVLFFILRKHNCLLCFHSSILKLNDNSHCVFQLKNLLLA